MADFNRILSVRSDDVKPPENLPMGHYNLVCDRIEFGESTQKKTPFCRVHYKVIGPGDDVDMEALAGVNNWQRKELHDDFYLSEAALFRFNEFMVDKLGIVGTGRELKEMVEEIRGKSVIAFVNHEPSNKQGDNRVFMRITHYVKI